MFNLEVHNEDAKKSYTLSYIDTMIKKDEMWVSTETGEGMPISRQKLFEILDKWFWENF